MIAALGAFGLAGKAAGALTGIASGIIGSKKRKAEQRAAQKEFDQNKQRFEGLDTSNLYANMENTMEDLTVNQQALIWLIKKTNKILLTL